MFSHPVPRGLDVQWHQHLGQGEGHTSINIVALGIQVGCWVQCFSEEWIEGIEGRGIEGIEGCG